MVALTFRPRLEVRHSAVLPQHWCYVTIYSKQKIRKWRDVKFTALCLLREPLVCSGSSYPASCGPIRASRCRQLNVYLQHYPVCLWFLFMCDIITFNHWAPGSWSNPNGDARSVVFTAANTGRGRFTAFRRNTSHADTSARPPAEPRYSFYYCDVLSEINLLEHLACCCVDKVPWTHPPVAKCLFSIKQQIWLRIFDSD